MHSHKSQPYHTINTAPVSSSKDQCLQTAVSHSSCHQYWLPASCCIKLHAASCYSCMHTPCALWNKWWRMAARFSPWGIPSSQSTELTTIRTGLHSNMYLMGLSSSAFVGTLCMTCNDNDFHSDQMTTWQNSTEIKKAKVHFQTDITETVFLKEAV